jgi:hypothetical protein
MRARRRERWLLRAERARDAFGLVLLLVLVTYVLTFLIANHGWTAVILVLATSATSIVAMVSSHVRAPVVHAVAWLSALTIALATIGAASGDRVWLNFASLIQISLLALAMGAVLLRVVTTAEVGSRTILGALSVYTVLGILFTFAYGTIDRIEGGPFFEGVAHPHGGDFIFFSYTTLTTTGYGNLVPGGQIGRMVAGIEMMLGQIFLVTLVAGLVSLWRPGESLRRRREKRAGSAVSGTAPPEAPAAPGS